MKFVEIQCVVLFILYTHLTHFADKIVTFVHFLYRIVDLCL